MRQAAAVHILKSRGLYGESLQPVGAATEEDLRREKKREGLDDLLSGTF